MKRLGTIVVAVLAMLSLGAAPAGAKGDPQGPHIREWFCILDLGTWHCVPPGVLATSGGPSEPSVNWGATTRQTRSAVRTTQGQSSSGHPTEPTSPAPRT